MSKNWHPLFGLMSKTTVYIYQFFHDGNLATLVELSGGGLCAGVQSPSCGLLFFSSINVASSLGVLSSNDRDLVEFCGACDHRMTLKSGCENQYSAERLP